MEPQISFGRNRYAPQRLPPDSFGRYGKALYDFGLGSQTKREGVPMYRFALPLAAALALSAGCAQATQQGVQALRNWKQADNCAKQAQAAYPNFDGDSNAKRDAKLKACLELYQLAPREPFAQPGAR
jgi:hypothetical protein